MPTEKNWESIFAFASPTPVKAQSTKCVCGGKNCQTAKKIKCVCRCHSEFHGAANRKGMEPLDKALGIEEPQMLPWLEVC